MRIEVLYTNATGNMLSTRCQGWDDDEALRQLKLTLDDLTIDGSRVLCLVRMDEPRAKSFQVN